MVIISMVFEIIRKSDKIKLGIFDLFNDLNLEKYNYHLLFKFDENRHRYDLDNHEKIIFYDDCFILVSEYDDRYLFDYNEIKSIELISFERED